MGFTKRIPHFFNYIKKQNISDIRAIQIGGDLRRMIKNRKI